MSDDILHQINHALQAKCLRTTEQFTSDAIALATTRSEHPEVLQRYLDEWRVSEYDPETPAGLNIRQTLEFRHNTLAKRQFRCDGTIEELQKIIDALKADLVLRYYEDVVTSGELVDWWAKYVNLYKALTAKQVAV